MKYFFLFCFTLIIPGMILRIPVGGAGILATDVVLPVFAFLWIFLKIIRLESFPKNSFIFPGFVFLILATISFLWGARNLEPLESALSASYLLRFFSILIFGWAAQDLFGEKKGQRALKNNRVGTHSQPLLHSGQSSYKEEGVAHSPLFVREGSGVSSFFKSFFWIFSIVIFLGFLQFYLVPSIADFSTEGGLDPHEGRMLGTWLDPNFFAGALGFVIPLLCAKIYETKRTRKKVLFSVVTVFFLLALFLTFSRSGYLSAASGLFLFFLLKDWRIILLGIIAIIIGLSVSERAQDRVSELAGTLSAVIMQNTDEVDATASLRVESWMNTINLWKKYPITGIGYNTYRYRASEEGLVDENYFSSGGSDSTHLTVLVTTGIFGFLSFLYFFGKLFWVNFQKFRKNNNTLFLGFSAGLLSIFLHATFVNSLLFPFLLMPILAVAGVLENEEY